MPDEANPSDFQKESFWLAKRVLLHLESAYKKCLREE